MRKRIRSTLLTCISLAVLLLGSCGRPRLQAADSPLPNPAINSNTGNPTDIVQTRVEVEDLLTGDSPVITKENFSQLHQEFRVGEGSFQNEFALSPDGSSLAILSGGGIVFIDTNTWERAGFHALDGIPKSIDYSPDGNSVAVLYAKRAEEKTGAALENPYLPFMQIINTSKNESSLELALSEYGCATNAAWNIAWSPDGEKIAYWGINSHFQQDQKDNICIHSSVDGSLLSRTAVSTWTADYTRPIFFASDSSKVYAIGADQNNNWSIINIISTKDGSLRSVSGGIGNITDFSYDAQKNFACLTGEGGTAIVSLVDFSHKESGEIAALKGEKLNCSSDNGSMFLSTESGYYLFGGENNALLWGPISKPENLIMGREPMTPRKVDRTDQVALSLSAGQIFILHNNYESDDDFLEVLDARTGKEVHRIHGQNPSARFGISPDNQFVAIGGYGDGQVQVWSVTEGERVTILRGHEKMVYQAAFSPDGNSIATASADATVKLWEGQTGELLFTFSGHQSAVWTVAFSNSGDKLYSAGDNQDLLVWNTSSGALESKIELAESPQQHRFLLLAPSGQTMLVASSCYSVLDCEVPWTAGDLMEVDLNTGKLLRKIPFATRELSISSDGSLLSGVLIKIPEIVHFSGQPLENINDLKVYKSPSGNGFLYGSAMSKDGLLFVGLNGKALLIWDVPTQSFLGSLPSDLFGRMLFSENQKLLWVMDGNLGMIVVWLINN